MENLKYKFTGETKKYFDVTLHQIVALKDFDTVKSGDIGGWVERESNLSQDGDALVYGNESIFTVSNVGTENGTLTVFNNQEGGLTCTRGCFIGTVEEFLEKSKKVHNDKIHNEYKLLVEVAKSRIICKKFEN